MSHTWYLQQQTVPIPLFLDKLERDEKARLAAKILMYETQKQPLLNVKMDNPIVKLSITPATKLVDLVGPGSLLLWDILGLGYGWLSVYPSEWENSVEFRSIRYYVKTVKVTNNVAERGIKVCLRNT